MTEVTSVRPSPIKYSGLAIASHRGERGIYMKNSSLQLIMDRPAGKLISPRSYQFTEKDGLTPADIQPMLQHDCNEQVRSRLLVLSRRLPASGQVLVLKSLIVPACRIMYVLH